MRRLRKRRTQDAELNITAFMNLMVVLVPFLLITAVFSRLAVLELSLPTSDDATAEIEQPPEFRLEITVRGERIEVGDRSAGVLRRFEAVDGGQDLDALSAYLVEVKGQFPDKVDATVLLEPDVSYEMLVAVMDRVRATEQLDDASRFVRRELFPEISIGDATVGDATSGAES